MVTVTCPMGTRGGTAGVRAIAPNVMTPVSSFVSVLSSPNMAAKAAVAGRPTMTVPPVEPCTATARQRRTGPSLKRTVM